MDWTRPIDVYCERIGPGLWAEPVNAVTNLAFILAGLWMWSRAAGGGHERALSAILVAIGIGSGLFHTFATAWAALADTVPILAFVLVYLYAANRRFFGRGRESATILMLGFFPFAFVAGWVFSLLPFFAGSSGYWPIALLFFGYAYALRARAPATARAILAGGLLLSASLVLRTVDEAVCDAVPVGTHFLWHLLNALLLGWMIEALRRHPPAPASASAGSLAGAPPPR